MLDIEEIIKATKGKLLNKTNDKIKSYSITSNEIKENCFFIPLKGEKTDGHNYILSAVENGAIGFFIA
ncbi:MAG: Mur ligase domain-containing protein, partial [Clostridia bacterium]